MGVVIMYLLALDQGTTSSRAIVFNQNLEIVASAQKEFSLLTQRAGWVEQDALEIWASQMATAQEAISRAGILSTEIAGIGIANQRETTILWHKKTGKPLGNALVWQDRRTHDWCLSQEFLAPRVQEITGLRIDPYFSASKLVWMLDAYPEARQLAKDDLLVAGTVDSWLLWQLTRGEVHATDVSNASRTMLMDLNSGCWSEELCQAWDIPMNILPNIVASGGKVAETAKGLFAKEIPIISLMGDQQAALFGHGCREAGMAKNTYGTGCFMLMNTGSQVALSQHKLLSTCAWQQENHDKQYALEGSVFMAGAIVQWLRDNLGFIRNSEEVEALANTVNDSAGVTLIPAFTGLGAPYWRADVSASISGLTRGSHKGHIARAALEAIAFQVADVLTAMQKDAPVTLTELRVDGGASCNNMLMQFQADILGVPVLRPTITEVTALGVAKMAALSLGWMNENDIDQLWQLDRRFEPNITDTERDELRGKWQQEIEKVLQ